MSNLSDAELSILIADFEDGRTVDPEEALKALYELKSLREAENNHSDHFRDATEKVCEWKPVNAYWTYRHIYVTCSGMDRYCVDPKVCPDCGGKVVVKS